MAYTVKKLAKLSGVSVRTLHFYDEVGLLKPAYYGGNGYRHYEEEQLLMLQQILFYRELGFELKQIKEILARSDFDKVEALKSHRKVLSKDLTRMRKLINTIDKTIKHLTGTKKMKDQEMYIGFDEQKQDEYEKYLIDRFGDGAKEHIAQSRRKVADWTKEDWERSGQEFVSICTDLVKLLEQNREADSTEVQRTVRRHYQWLKRFWTPNRESYAGHAQLIVDSELHKAYDPYHPRLAGYLADGIKRFAERELA